MPAVELRLSMRTYDYLVPLFLGNVQTPGVKLVLDQASDLMVARDRMDDTSPNGFHAAEVSFNRFVAGKANGDDSLVGLPAFILRNFRHRCWYVRRDSPLQTLKELKGKRVGTDSWNDTGTMWSRAAMRDAGVELDQVQWVLGKLSATVSQKKATPGTDSEPAGGAEKLAEGQYLLDALESGSIDAITTASTPEDIYKPGGRFRRLLQNYPEVEAEYRKRMGFRPGLHIIAVRQDFVERHPEAVLVLMDALEQAWSLWWAKTKRFGEASPWMAYEVETQLRDFADEMPPYGLDSPAHRKMIAWMCHEQFAQKLVPQAADPEMIFHEFMSIKKKYHLSSK